MGEQTRHGPQPVSTTVPPAEKASVLVAGVGNVFLRDDAFGSEVARVLLDQEMPEGVVVGDYGIGGVHLAYELLEGYENLVLIDTTDRGGDPGDLFVIEVDHEAGGSQAGGGGLDSHSMDPASVFSALETLGGAPPPTLLIGCQPADTSDGMGMTEAVEAAVDVAVDKVHELVEDLLGAQGAASEGGRAESDPAGDDGPATVERDREEG